MRFQLLLRRERGSVDPLQHRVALVTSPIRTGGLDQVERTDLIGALIPLGLLALAVFTGTMADKRHRRSLEVRERASQRMPTITFRDPPVGWQVGPSGLVTGSVVMSIDHFKKFLAGWRMIFGGPIRSYEGVMDRARREALLRLKEDARQQGFNAVINVRIETSAMASSAGNGQGVP